MRLGCLLAAAVTCITINAHGASPKNAENSELYGKTTVASHYPELHLHSTISEENNPLFSDIDVNIYSTYLSSSLQNQCKKLTSTASACQDDGVKPELFLQAIKQQKMFRELSPSVSKFDYEILIGNQTKTSNDHQVIFTEITLQWRGVEIDSWQLGATADIASTNHADAILKTWADYANKKELFSSEYLYQRLGASNYSESLSLPEQIGQFKQAAWNLYPDPLKGVMVRYIHPEYEEAVLDVSVYPILDDPNLNSNDLLFSQLKQEHADASYIAEAREMDLHIDTPISEFTLDKMGTGAILSMRADKVDEESLYATIYIFKQKDKFIKLSTTFPEHVGNALVKNALPLIDVPQESELMSQIRGYQIAKQ